ncbi:hypothetical protein M2372_003845 [Chryseobacterium sp. BIGb0232]|nr:hypothetical protein [Chryseobacterium sp. BIGb0232]ROS14261.1 hypothetical protein EDF65_3032 [Chryseobacterium nakagawai]
MNLNKVYMHDYLFINIKHIMDIKKTVFFNIYYVSNNIHAL